MIYMENNHPGAVGARFPLEVGEVEEENANAGADQEGGQDENIPDEGIVPPSNRYHPPRGDNNEDGDMAE
jgi:hypothetical protein